MPLQYQQVDALVLPSLTRPNWKEQFGRVLIEAMASGVPVIATPAGGIADNLRHERNGLAYPAGDARAMAAAMTRVAQDTTLRRRLAIGAREWAEEHSWDAELDRLDASYREVIAYAARNTSSAGVTTGLRLGGFAGLGESQQG
jgi:glycosyltransferase involved in cell wall biosynthesis